MYKIDEDGIHPTKEKIKAILDATAPVNQTQLRAYLGMSNLYRSFLPEASTMQESLNMHLRAEET